MPFLNELSNEERGKILIQLEEAKRIFGSWQGVVDCLRLSYTSEHLRRMSKREKNPGIQFYHAWKRAWEGRVRYSLRKEVRRGK